MVAVVKHLSDCQHFFWGSKVAFKRLNVLANAGKTIMTANFCQKLVISEKPSPESGTYF
jgi:hypothetical protein